ncbi:proteasomal ubiquitin receptor ADRM1-like [Amphiura filiformis]|uniref:proteasomal ubiquitin receptor ADRM1-like n=1 Tax=Amphiura filiformis TaxID=82378 RepID=UPI003B2213FE
MSLFGSSTGGGRSSSKNLVEFRAGKMHLKGTTVTPDKRKGQLYLYQSDDSLMHFCWKDRTTGNVEDDLIIFPDDCEFKRVAQCTTGRVYILKFKSSSRKFFFWLQEPKTDKDEENCKKVNDTLNNPPAPGSSGGGRSGGLGGLPPELAGLGGEAGLQSMLGNMDQQQLLQLLGGSGLGGLGNLGLASLMGPGAGRSGSAQSSSSSAPPSRVQSSPGPRPTSGPPASQPRAATAAPTASSTSNKSSTPSSDKKDSGGSKPATPAPSTTGAAAAGAGGQTPIQLSDLQNILSNLNIPNPGGAEQQPPVDMVQVLSSEAMAPILANPEMQQQLLPHLPEGELLPRDPEQLRTTLQNPQFQQAVNMFTAAFQSGQLGPLMAQFGLGDKAAEAATKGDLVAFSQALQGKSGQAEGNQEEKKDEKKEDKDDKKKDEPEEMSLD